MEHILKVAEKAGIPEEYVDCYGKYKGKISSKDYDKIKDNPDAKLILVTAVNPTPRRRRQNNRYHRPDRGHCSRWARMRLPACVSPPWGPAWA